MMRKLLTVLAMLAVLPHLLQAQVREELLDPNVRDLLHEALSGELAKEHVIAITRYHRIQGSRGYRDAAQYVLRQLRGYGFSEKDAYIESFVSDGKVQYQTWQSPSGWDISSAELRMVEPYNERIVSYPEIAMSVMTYSNTGDDTAELIWVGAGTSDSDYAGKSVGGKFVLATGYGGDVHRLAVLKYGARAVVCYLDDERAKEYPDMLQYTGMWPKTEEIPNVTFGFNLTNRQGTKLRSMLESGRKVVLHGWVKGIGLEPYWMDVVVAHIRGTDLAGEELIFSAHLDHPKESANDNASGSAAILDIARTFKDLIEAGRLPQPARSFRFVWIPEWYGTMAYIDSHPELRGPELGGTFLANMNMDMVGENLELLHSRLILTRTPSSLPSCVNDVVENMAQMVDRMNIRTPRGSRSRMNYQVAPYAGGSDHMMFIDRKIPGIMFSHEPDYTHHTSEDTPDKVDPVELERCEIISAGAMWYLANLSPANGMDLAHLVGSNVLRMRGATMRSLNALLADTGIGAADTRLAEAQNILDRSLDHALGSVRSVLHFNNAERVTGLVDWISGNLRRQHEGFTTRLKALAGTDLAAELPSDGRIPVRLTRGPLDFDLPESKLDSARASWYRSGAFTLEGDMRFELVNFIDGVRTVSDIRNALSEEFKPIELAVVARYIEDLVRAGAISWK
jgi:aminopeptidase YwaD